MGSKTLESDWLEFLRAQIAAEEKDCDSIRKLLMAAQGGRRVFLIESLNQATARHDAARQELYAELGRIRAQQEAAKPFKPAWIIVRARDGYYRGRRGGMVRELEDAPKPSLALPTSKSRAAMALRSAPRFN